MALTALLSLKAILPARASYNNSFSGTVGFSWKTVSSNVTKSNDSSIKAGVCWTSSNQGSHKQWFRVLPASGSTGGAEPMLVLAHDGVNRNFVTSTTVQYGTYYLQSHREHIIDPSTLVSGTWRP